MNEIFMTKMRKDIHSVTINGINNSTVNNSLLTIEKTQPMILFMIYRKKVH